MLKRYFESLKVRDLIIGRIALLILLSVSTLTIAAPSWTGYEAARITIAFLTLFATVALYWVGKNGYIFSVTGLLDIVINRNFGAFHDFDKTSREKMERIEEQRLLLDNYASDCPNFSLLQFFHYIHTKKNIDTDFRRLADSPRFRGKLEINFWILILAHFFVCQRIANRKDRVMRIIFDEVNKKRRGR